MYFSNIPEGLAGVDSGIVLLLADCNPDLVTEVRIISGGEILGIKRLRGETSYGIDAACYLRGTIEVEPALSARATFSDAGSRLVPFHAAATQYAPEDDVPGPMAVWVESGTVTCTAGKDICPVLTPLSDMDWLEIATGESLEIPFIAQATRFVSSAMLYLDRGTAYDTAQFFCETDTATMYIYRLLPDNFETELECPVDGSMDIKLRINVYGGDEGSVTFEVPVAVRDKTEGSVRLCWQNRYGAVDYFTFSPVTSETVEIEKDRILSASGREVTGVGAKRSITVRSPFMPASRVTQLASVAASPRVWIVDGEEAVAVDVTTSRIETDTEGPRQLVLTLRLPE